MSSLRLALVQAAASTDPAKNRARVDSLEVPPADLVILPEAFARDLGSPEEDLRADAERLDGPFVSTLVERAGAHGGAWLAGMIERTDEALPVNTLVLVDGDGLVASYRKIHLYDSFGYCESERISAGPVTPTVVELAGLKVGLQTCYDLRFPELSRAQSRIGMDLLVVPAAWVAGPRKVAHWRTLLAARAIENVCFVAGVGQPGPRYCGHSQLVDPRGEVLGSLAEGEDLLVVDLDTDLIAAAREENPSLLNRRDANPDRSPVDRATAGR